MTPLSHRRDPVADQFLRPLIRTGFAGLLATMLCGCGTSQIASTEPTVLATPQPAREGAARYVPAVVPTKVAVTPAPPKRERARAAAAEAIAESNKAAAASAIALKASREAAQAAAQAAKAAAQAAAVTTPSAQPTAAQTVLYSTDAVDPSRKRAQVAMAIQKLDQGLQSIDHARQTADGLSRIALAAKFLQSAREAFAEGSYTEADGLARKASMMIAPLTGNSAFPRNNPAIR